MSGDMTFDRVSEAGGGRWRTRDIVVAATVGVVFGFVFWAWNVLWNTLVAPASVVAPLWGFLTYGVWLVPAVLAPLIVRRPGAALFAEMVAAGVSAFLPGNVWGPDVLLDLGFRYDSSVFPVKDSLYGMPDAERFPYVIRERDGRRLVEFPITTTEIFGRNLPLGGGGYLRLLPYVYMKWGMRRVNRREGQGTVVYIHPWEVDPGQPRMKTAGRRGFSSHYVNLARTEGKLRSLLRDFRFAPMRDCLTLA